VSELWISRYDPPRADSPVSCVVCGCRLAPAGEAAIGYRHLPSLDAGVDARGDRPHCVDMLHDNFGYAIEASASAA
jgi:hypothetical protein